jgi:hypothetical protein
MEITQTAVNSKPYCRDEPIEPPVPGTGSEYPGSRLWPMVMKTFRTPAHS